MLIDDLKTRYPELAPYADKWVPVLEGELSRYYGVSDYDTASKCDKSILLALMGHLIWFNEPELNGTVGGQTIRTVASESAGSVSVSYAISTSDNDREDFFMLSKYGQLYLQLTSSNMGAAWV